MTTSFSLEFIGSKFLNIEDQDYVIMKDTTGKNYLYINGEGTDGNGYELWRTDGTESGTTLVKNINPSDDSSPYYFAVMEDIINNKNYLYFTATDGTNGRELWRTDGTTTTLVKDINPSGNSSPTELTVMKDIVNNKNYLYFQANDGTNGTELWRTDGTTTTLVKDINPSGNSSPTWLTVMEDENGKNYLYFRADNGTNGYELWRSDGTDIGTTLVKDININGSGDVKNFTVMEDENGKNYLYFRAENSSNGTELWRSDGTLNGTTLVKNVNTAGDGVSSPSHLTVMKDTMGKNYLYFSALSVTYGRELWRSDGTDIGTTLVKDIYVGSGSSSNIRDLTVMEDETGKNYLYFQATDGDNGAELWRTDGTTTTLVKDIMTGSGDGDPYDLIVMPDATGKNYLYFAASHIQDEYYLWRSDGTPEGTTFTASSTVHAGYDGGTEPYSLVVMSDTTGKNYLYFIGAADSDGGVFNLYRLVITESVSVEPIICFKEGTQILTLDLNTRLDTYKNIENINVGDLVSTYKHGYVPVNIIGYSNLINTSSDSRITNKLYVYKKDDHQELIEDLYMTGGHAVLLDYENITDNQCDKMMEEMGKLYKTDDKFRLMAKLDYRCDTVDDNRQYRVWHICLDHENEWMNYGIYANGMLVESTCERHAQNFLHKKENVVELIKDQCQLNALLV